MIEIRGFCPRCSRGIKIRVEGKKWIVYCDFCGYEGVEKT